ncbi:RnfABCDGE type electron transport complex subunit D [Bathymodiolus thermophilus thioautotrophic gill symbiont]|jgi:electron transport complex protein RnfD|uniref:Ion-translocating oxidoreductase complex subunit D n=1 Tax=Bathymodiolus thermophilus thioautotrophic gill symbiont TaxID=2360 RepID=A0A1J5U5R9_9GAMM|nr:RnfABCDGE type electron transport complex subunit D [Bathymodiolus thermophilus thioautotrophic gill symbiont]AYQ57587.1 Electron transport complex subunit D [Bathymodiolus thermophilus thioautotrophic gill symbiont]OIR23737.1 electron transport complex subunit RsxD [Bathymodiolus thermophilus thioautotrophic gill symbiont]CAB5500525.1 Electron transport complex protein RnfD [Bathymodiolus thermophilus thioautotrophic gill symbiont]
MIAIFNSTSQMMRQVIYALALGIIAIYTFFGWGVIVQIVLAVVTALATESLFLKIRKRPIMPAISDGSAVLTALLLAVSIPSIAPWWVVVVGVSFAIIFGKQLYGGLGNNPFNPAMLGYAFLLISYPLPMTTWASEFINLSQAFEIIFNLNLVDALSGATHLDEVKTQLGLGKMISEINVHSATQAWVNMGFLLGGVYLLIRRVIFWQIPSAFLLGIVVTAFFLSLGSSEYYLPVQNHLMLGGTMLGAFFIATDPVSASTTPKGRLIYGFLIGVLIVIIRTFGNYPDSVAFAVLLMNITVPLIDYYTQPRVFGKSE